MVIGHGLKLTLTGVVIGVGVSLALTRFMGSQLMGVSATDPVTFSGVALLLIVVAVAACFIPAQGAMRVDPTVALRYE
jgi:putative ABC transport system permease protein